MDFDSILEEWENKKDRSKPARPTAGSSSPSTGTGGYGFGDEVLDRYLPGAETVAAKNTEESPPVAEGRSIWLRRPVQDVLDLHGLNGREARVELGRFIGSMRRRELRKGLVIHGKGLHSRDGSVLAPLVREYLEMSSEVGEFGRAGRTEGGSGATWFILRQRSR